MKVFPFALSAGFISAIMFSNWAYAQSAENSAFINSKNFRSSIRHLVTRDGNISEGIYIAGEKNTNVRAYKDFQDRFKKVDNAIWFFDPKVGFESYFIRDGYGNRVIYDKKGRWLYSLITYGEDKLSRDIRAQIKSTYFDFTITLVEEVQMNEGIEYVVYLTDKSTIRILKVNPAGDIQTLQELTKG